MSDIRLPSEVAAPVANRLKRARGQIDGILRMLDDGRDCGEIVTQIAAVSKAVDRAGFALIAAGLEQCVRTNESPSDAQARLEKMFLSLA
jgi:DNA-binding FrmR family transcriptional regulator